MYCHIRNLSGLLLASALISMAGVRTCIAQDASPTPMSIATESVDRANQSVSPQTLPVSSTIPTTEDLRLAQSTGRMYVGISGDEMEAILKSLNYVYTRSTNRSGDPVFRIAVDRYRVTMLFDKCTGSRCGIVQLYAGFDLSGNFDLRRINEWNRTKRFSRAYTDEEGDPILESEIAVDGGMSAKSIENFIRLYDASVVRFTSFIGLDR